MLLMESLWAAGKRGTSSKEPWDEAATSRLLNETIRILEETTGDKLPVP